jgi:hypothetical protein
MTKHPAVLTGLLLAAAALFAYLVFSRPLPACP